MMLLSDYERILKASYLDLVSKESKKKIKSERIRCCNCGRSNVTLMKHSEGKYICVECKRKGEDR